MAPFGQNVFSTLKKIGKLGWPPLYELVASENLAPSFRNPEYATVGGGDGARWTGRGLVRGGKGAPPAHRDTIS